MSDVRLRPLRDDEEQLVVEASMGTINWPGPRFSLDEARANPSIERYLHWRPERGDVGIVAEAGDEVVGLVWLAFFPADDAGYGFVAEGVPEYAIWVRDGWRRQGLGCALTRAIIDEARRRGLDRISLSVEATNPSRFLYAAEGFVPVPGGEEDGVMLLTL